MSKQNDTKNPQPKNDDIHLADLPLTADKLDGVVGGARPAGETNIKTTDVTKCCW